MPATRSNPLGIRRPRAAVGALAALAAGALVAVSFAGCGLVGPAPVSTVGKVDFETPLAIPPLAPSTVDADGTRVFSLEAQAGTTEFAPGVPSDTWGFNGSYLGPTLVAKRGEHVRVDVANSLDVPTTVHWHGMHLPAEMDGGPHQMVEPDATWSPEWDIDQQAATLWYHPHPHGETESHVARGLAGMFLVQDDAEAALPLPREYGVDDVPVIVQDTGFSADGAREGGQRGFAGGLGDELLVNGTRGPYLDVHDELVRLRLLNASTARSYAFTWSDGRPVELIATDGGLLEASVELDRVLLSPGERAEVLVRVEPGERLVLRSEATAESAGMIDSIAAMNGGTDSFDVLELRAADTLDAAPDVPERLATLPPVDEVAGRHHPQLHARRLRDQRLGDGHGPDRRDRHGRHDRALDRHQHEPDAAQLPRARRAVPHRLDRRGAAAPELSGWKDTIFARPETEFVLVLRFEDYADPDTPYMYHCHLLWHEDQGMMGQFAVVEPGQSATMTGGTDHEH